MESSPLPTRPRSGALRRKAAGLIVAALASMAAPAFPQSDPGANPGTDISQQNGDGLAGTSAGALTVPGAGNGATVNSEAGANRRSPTADQQARDMEGRTRLYPGYPRPPKAVPGEFEQYVNALPGVHQRVRRLGASLMTDMAYMPDTVDPLPMVPDSYVIRQGDEVRLALWGSVNTNQRLVVDRDGTVSIPRVGTVRLAGLTQAEAVASIERQVANVFRNFHASLSVGRVRPIRVFVSGFVERPGSVVVGGTATVLHALMRAGGPSAAGSFRDISLWRNAVKVAHFDLYDLLLKGDRGADLLVQPDDVIQVGAVGPQVAVIGSVNQPSIVELRDGEDLRDVIRMAGGFDSVADRTRVAVERLSMREQGRVQQVSLAPGSTDSLGLAAGDVVRAYSAVDNLLPIAGQNKRVHVEGEVEHPGDYILPPGSTLPDALAAAGGLTASAWVFGTELDRESVRKTQQVNVALALREFETSLTVAGARHVGSADEAAAQAQNDAANQRLLEQLRNSKPTGRLVLGLGTDATTLPRLPLEDGDRLVVPSRSAAVGVFGSVFNAGSFVYRGGEHLIDYLRAAGGATRHADSSSIFVVRADGTVISGLANSSFWRGSDAFLDTQSLPGDTIFVPEDLDRTTITQNLKDWGQIFSQFGLGIAALKTITQ